VASRGFKRVFCLEKTVTIERLGSQMKVECPGCNKVYNFKVDRLPPKAFSFSCKICADKIQITQAQLDAVKTEAKKKKEVKTEIAKKKAKPLLSRIWTDKLKKSFVKIGDLASDMADRSERDWVLTLAKSVAYFSMGLIFVLILLGGFTLYSVSTANTVTYAEVSRSLDLKQDPLLTIQAATPDVKIPKVVRKYLGGDNKATFVEWMNGLAENQKRDFIKNLELIIRKASQEDPEHIFDYINEYKSLKFTRSVDKPAVKYLFKFGLIIAMITLIGLLGLFSLILVRLTVQKPHPG
jgi:hypothetical protein